MSGFIKRNKTVNPAGGVNPAQAPNVGQYGWTSFDAGNVNQIIEYVNICKAFADSAKNSADYVASKFGELQEFINYIDEIYEQIGPIFNNIDVIYKDIVQKHKEVQTMHDDCEKFTNQAIASAESAAASKLHAEESAAEAALSAKDASISEVAASTSAQEARDIAEELRKGQVYRGTWNVEANNGYPAHPDTNSVWDVTLNEGSASFRTPDGILWFWGDRLLFLKDDGAFSQIESGSGVLSVNGKSGAVTLIASDVGALSASGGVLNEPLKVGNFPNSIQNIEGTNMIRSGGAGSHATVVGNITARTYIDSPDETLILRAKGTTDRRIYTEGFKPTAADVGAVGKTGNQVMTGALAAVKYTASDAYAFVSAMRQYQGMFMGVADNTPGRRTIIGGGGTDNGDGLGTVVIRANGITDNAGEITFSPTGLITAPVEATAGNHLANKSVVDKAVKVVSDRIDLISPMASGAMPKSGGTFTGPIVLKDGVPGAIKINNNASISYQNGGGAVFHSYAANANTMAWSQGDGGENRLMTLTSGGQLSTEGPVYSRYGQITESKNDAVSIGMEAPEEAAPYISCKAPGETSPSVGIRFGQSEILIESGKPFAASNMRVGNDGGLKFAPTGDLSGITYGIGVNTTSRTLGVYQYSNGTYNGAVWDVDNARNTFFHSGLTVQASLVVRGGAESTYQQVRNNGNPSFELHEPGIAAVMMYKPQGTSTVRFCRSNGAGGEAAGFGGVDADGMFTVSGRYRATYQAANRGWGAVGSTPFYAEGISVENGSFRSIAGGYSVLHGNWSLENTYGMYADPDPEMTAHVLQMADGGSFNRFWRFCNGGRLYSPTGWQMVHDGTLIGTVFGSYSSMINWCTASFAPASDARLKTVLGESTKSALDVVDQFQFKKFAWKEEAGEVYTSRPKKVTEIGLIAQDVEAIDANFVKDVKTFGEDSVDIKTLDTVSLLALALKAIQEQQSQINELKEKLNAYVQ